MKKALYLLFLSFGMLAPLRAEKINLEVYASRFDSIPIGVVDFKNKTSDLIKLDQDHCQRF